MWKDVQGFLAAAFRKASLSRWLFWSLGIAITPQAAAVACSSAPLPEQPRGREIEVKNVYELQRAVRSAEPGNVILLAPGEYRLTVTLAVRTDNITLRGRGGGCDDVRLKGAGMNEADYGGAPHGIWSDASGLTVQNLTIRDFYQHGVVLNPGAASPTFQNIRILDVGSQLIKANPSKFGDGVDGGLVEHSVFAYTEGPPMVDRGGGTGYTNGVDVHAGADWVIRGNRFENFHAPDHADHLWAPAVLMWNGASNSLVEDNRFVNVGRAIAFGLLDRADDHHGGVIRNNKIEYAAGLYSASRRRKSDGAIIVWSSPETVVEGNEILTRGNLRYAIEFRFNTEGAMARGNIMDAPIGRRDGGDYEASDNRRLPE